MLHKNKLSINMYATLDDAMVAQILETAKKSVVVGVLFNNTDSDKLRKKLNENTPPHIEDQMWEKFMKNRKEVSDDFYGFMEQRGTYGAGTGLLSKKYDFKLLFPCVHPADEYIQHASIKFPSYDFFITIDPNEYVMRNLVISRG